MIKRNHFFVAVALIISTSGFILAQNQHKNRARGFNASGVYSAGDIDNINLFNGNLTVSIPIGQAYPVNGQLSYSFTLVYNSNPWSPREVCSSAIDQDTHFSSFFTLDPRFIKLLSGGQTYKLILESVNQTPGGDPYEVAGIEPSSSNCWTIQDPNPAANAGLGWQLSFGKLYKPRNSDLDDRPNYTEKSQWVYMSADGSEHTFYPTLHEDDPEGSSNIWYTRDSSYLRLNMSPPANVYGGDMMIEFPNGQKHYFKNLLIRKADPGHQITEVSEEKLVAIVDQFDNYMKIEYVDTDLDGLKDDEWLVTDSVGRSHEVTFAKKVDGYQKVVTAVSLAGFGGSSIDYGFTYESGVDINRPAPHITHELIPESTDTLKVPLLTAVTLPNGSQYAMPVDSKNLAAAAYDVPGVESTMTGLLGKIVLPTGGQIEWKYRAENPTTDQQAGYGYKYGYGAAARHFLRRTIGVRRRIITINKGSVANEKIYTWKYDPKVGDNYPSGCQQSTLQSTCSPAEIVNKVTTPDCDANNNCSYTLNYFSIWPYPYGGEGVSLDALKRGKSDLHGSDYALPFTKDPRAQSETGRPTRTIADVNGDPLFLSQAIFDKNSVLKRSVYVRYETDVLALNDGYGQGFDANTRTVASRTVYHDDAAVYAETQYHDFDGLGHFRQTELFGNFGSGDRRLDIVWFNRANGTYSVNPATNSRTTTFTPVTEASSWLLDTYDSQISSDFNSYRSTAYFSFNSKGMIQAKRTLRDFETPGAAYKLTAKDHLILYGYDSSGNLTTESHYGGDKKANVSTAATFSASGASEYSITTSYRCGDDTSTISTSIPNYASFTGNLTPSLIDETVDCSTGLISATKDSAGVKTSYQYDSMLRLTRVTPQQGAISKITYFDVQDGATDDSPQVTLEYLAQDGSFTPMGDEVYKYDQLGRVFEQHQRMPGVGSTTAVYQKKSFAFNGMGWKTAESEWSDGETNEGRQTKYENFDPFGRPAKITAADGSVKQVFYNGVRLVTKIVKVGTQVNAGASVTIGQEDATTVEAYDRQGRIWIVREQSGVAGTNVYTTYSYNVNNQIVSAITPAQMSNGSSVTQTRGFTYDNVGNLRSENLPELSGRTYDNYDTLGNVGSTFTGKSNLRYTYDFAGRMTLLEEQFGAQYRPLKDYIFYTSSTSSNYSLGKVQTARRYNWVINPYQPEMTEAGVVVREDFTYSGIDGRLSKTTTSLNADKDTNHTPNVNAYTFDQTFTYDARGNLVSQTYPQCTNTTCTSTPGAARPWRTNYAYQNNRLVNVGGGAGTGNIDDVRYASAIRYYANGMLKNVVHGNATRDVFDLDPNYIGREAKITVQTGAGSQLWTSGTYSYDGTGNITKIGSDWFAYDKVGRVVEGSVLDAGGKKRKYTYDAFGNVTSYLTYNGITPSGGNPFLLENFATNSQPSSNRQLLNYDGAGNAVGLVGQPPLYTYDAVNMIKYAPGFTYLYTEDDERIWSVDNSTLSNADTTWFEDSLPAGAIPDGSFESWNWTSTNPSPYAGSLQHQSLNLSGIHQHFFTKATNTMKVGSGGSVFAYVYIDPQSPPSEIMLQWDDGSGNWAHRAFWGADQIPWGTPGTTSPDHNYRGALPAAGSWQRLEVPASAVGLENVTVSGMAFTLFGGKASWDHAGQESSAVVETISLRGLGNELLREYQVKGGDGVNHWTWLKDNIYSGTGLLASETPQGVRHYHLDHLGTPKMITDAAGNPLPGAPYLNFAFGEETSSYQPVDWHVPPPDEKLRFTGQEKNQDYSALGLYYMHARYYLPGSAKFLSIDPGRDWDSKQPQSLNLYSYVRNNPLTNVDPDGRYLNPYNMLFDAASSATTGFSLLTNTSLSINLSPIGTMSLSQAGWNTIKDREGHAPNGGFGAYNDSSNYCTIGWGHLLHGRTCCTAGDYKAYQNFSEQQANALLASDVQPAVNAVNAYVKAPINQKQFDSLVSFTFNFNGKTLARANFLTPLNFGMLGGVPSGLAQYNKGRDKHQRLVVSRGLTARRTQEAAPFKRSYHLWKQ